MEAARRAVAEFTARRGHKTEVEEVVRPAITLETIKPTRHEILTQAIDKEVHQHHYHTTVQPISHKEVLPTKHTHNLIAINHKDFTHETQDLNLKVQDAHAKEMALFVNHSRTLPVVHTKSALPAVIGEHVHHHVHEIVQPIVYKETIVPEVVHTTVPIHEVHHHEPVHHQMSQLPLIAMTDFIARHKPGKSIHQEVYEGAPRPYNSKMLVDPAKFRHKPAPIDVSAASNTKITPPLSPVSVASSDDMPSTPKNGAATEPAFRNSEDSNHDFSLSPTLSTKSPKRHTFQAEQMQTPQAIRY